MKRKAKTQENERKTKSFDFNVLKEEITPDNVLAMSEIIAFTETRFLISYMGTRMQKMSADLYADIKNSNDISCILSDGYDLVQECAVYLCEHYGRQRRYRLYQERQEDNVIIFDKQLD